MTIETMPENPAAFPCTGEGFQSPAYTQKGMTLRDYFAGHAPVDYQMAFAIWGGDTPHSDADRAGFFAVWALLRYEYADAMLTARKGPDHGRG